MWKTLCYEAKGCLDGQRDGTLQDKTIALTINGVSVICLSSGDRAIETSVIASDLVVKTASEYVASNFDELYSMDPQDLKLKIFTHLHNELTESANKNKINLSDLAAGLSLVAVKGVKYISCFIGDGIIANYKNRKITIINFGVQNGPIFLTDDNAESAFKAETGLLKGVRGFILMSSGTVNGFHLDQNKEFDEIVGIIVSTVGSITSVEMDAHIKQVFENFVIHKTNSNCSIAVMSTPKCASRYYALSNDEKIELLKLSSNDENSLNRVRDLDNILNLIENGKSVAQLAEILHIKESAVKNKLRILVFNNILSLSASGVYKKID